MAEAQLENDVETIKSINDGPRVVQRSDDGDRHGRHRQGPRQHAQGVARLPRRGQQLEEDNPSRSRRNRHSPSWYPSAYNPVFMPVGFMSQTHRRPRSGWIPDRSYTASFRSGSFVPASGRPALAGFLPRAHRSRKTTSGFPSSFPAHGRESRLTAQAIDRMIPPGSVRPDTADRAFRTDSMRTRDGREVVAWASLWD